MSSIAEHSRRHCGMPVAYCVAAGLLLARWRADHLEPLQADHESSLFVTSRCSHVRLLLLHRRLVCQTCCQYGGSAALDVVEVVWLLWLPTITTDSRFSRAVSLTTISAGRLMVR